MAYSSTSTHFMAQPSAREQQLLELTNRFRLNPAAEYDRLVNSNNADVISALNFFDVDLAVLADQWRSLVAAPVLAWSGQLNESAAVHNQLMIDSDQQSHFLPGEPGILDRIENAGDSNYTAVSENIYAYSRSPFHAHAGFVIDWGDDDNNSSNGYGTGIQNPAGHRISILSSSYREIGISIVEETNAATAVGPLVVTQHFGNQASVSDAWLLGVAFQDFDDDDFYDVGEGLGDVSVNVSSGAFSTSVQTGQAGGYQTLLPQGTYDVEFVRNGQSLQTYSNVAVGSDNVKRDLLIEVGTAPSEGLGKVVGIQFNDVNENGQKDSGELGIAGRTVFIDANKNKQFDSGERSAATNAEGTYILNNLTPGTHHILPVLPAGREQTFPDPSVPIGSETYQLDGGSGNSLAGFSDHAIAFNQFETLANQATLTSITVGLSPQGNPTKLFIYQDADGDNTPDDSEEVLEVTPTLSGNNGFVNVAITPTQVTGTFFVGAFYEKVTADYNWLIRDTVAPANQSWLAVTPNANSFTAESYSSANWLLRANAAGPVPQIVTVAANDTVSNVDFGDRLDINILTGTAQADSLTGTSSKDSISGKAGNDTLLGRSGDDAINGDGGNDTINGGVGDDKLRGGAGNDKLVGHTGHDKIHGGNGNDNLSGDAGDDTLDGVNGNDTLDGGSGSDLLRGGDGRDTLNGGSGNDNLVGGNTKDFLFGGNGHDRLDGSGGFDELTGGKGNDRLRGQAGNDILTGTDPNAAGTGHREVDNLTGGLGADRFVLGNASDIFYGSSGSADFAIIKDFDLSENDVVQLQGSSSQYSLERSGRNTFIFLGSDDSELIGVVKGVAFANFNSGFAFVS